MPPSNKLISDLIEALLDDRVITALGSTLGETISKLVEDKVNKVLGPIQTKLGQLVTSNEQAKQEISALKTENKDLKSRVEALEAYSRIDNVIIHGLHYSSFAEVAAVSNSQQSSQSSSRNIGATGPTENCEATAHAVLSFVNNVLDIPLSPLDISIAHRLKKTRQDSTPAPVIVRFTNRRARNAVIHARKRLSTLSAGRGVYINEHLSKARESIFREARRLVKEKKLFRAWTNNGEVYVRVSSAPDSRPLLVDDVSKLP